MQIMTHQHTKELDVFYNEHKNNCTCCGLAFTDGMCVHLGYLANREHAVLCDNCAEQLHETVARYRWSQDPYERPLPHEKLWRYMDVAKFISLLSTESLYFASASSFDDPYEGAKGVFERKEKWDSFYRQFFRYAVMTIPGADPKKMKEEEIEAQAQRLLLEMESLASIERKHTYISCWHSNSYESEAMWKLYAVNIKNAIAIQTTTQNLYEALDKSPSIKIGKINYIDYQKQFAPVNGSFWYKRKSFEHEKEVRAVLKNFECENNGIYVPVNVEKLITQIHISPYAPEWFVDVIHSITEKYKISKPILYSEMNATPFY